jgi:hypothetical protein
MVLAINSPYPSPFQVHIYLTVLSLAAAAFAALIPGLLKVEISGLGVVLRAAGALGMFLLVFFYEPASRKLSETVGVPVSLQAHTDCSAFQSDRGWTLRRNPTDSSQWIETTPEGVQILHRQANESNDYIFLIRRGVYGGGVEDNMYLRIPKRGGLVGWKRHDVDGYNDIYPVTCTK